MKHACFLRRDLRKINKGKRGHESAAVIAVASGSLAHAGLISIGDAVFRADSITLNNRDWSGVAGSKSIARSCKNEVVEVISSESITTTALTDFLCSTTGRAY